MAKTRVSELAKELGLSAKELLAYLAEIKIPATSASSTLEPVYVKLATQKLAPMLEERAAELEQKKKKEEALAKKKAEAAAQKAEKERIAAEKRREAERKREQKRKAEEEKARLEEEAAKKAEEEAEKKRAKQEEIERKKRAVPGSKKKSFSGLLEQIAEQEKTLLTKKKESGSREGSGGQTRVEATGDANAPGRGKRKDAGFSAPEGVDFSFSSDKSSGKRGNKHRNRADVDKFSRLERETDFERAIKKGEGKRQSRRKKREQEAAKLAEEQALQEAIANDQDISELGVIKVPQGSTVAELAELLHIEASDIIKRLFLLGTPLTMTQSMSDDLIELVADDLGAKVKVLTPEEENSFTFYDDAKDLLPRPPVVTVMGHVDHGKTSTLDAIRHTGIAEGEAGGITQHIGASQVEIGGRIITFVDTPGHETFTAMRARGAKVTDIVVLVVAADDGVMPQTLESISHAKAADVPIVVAINKIDKDDANPDRVRGELAEHGVSPEEWGGDNMFVNISAKKKQGIDELLETILLQADVLELKANPNTFASGYVLEAKLDKGRGPVATLLVNRGTLHVGDALVAGNAYGKVRAMMDAHGNKIDAVGPSDPVEILGLSSVPAAGDEFRVFTDERDARDLADERSLKARIEEQTRARHITLENLFSTMEAAEVKELNLVVKADVQGSIEALEDAFSKIDQTEVRINVIHSAVGAVTETDVTLAAASQAIIIAFGVRPTGQARKVAEKEDVQIRPYTVIYQAIEDIDAARIGMLKPTQEEVETGIAEVRDIFKVPKAGVAAGCMVTSGEISRDDLVRLTRDGVVVYEGEFSSVRRFKDDVKSVKQGYECGLSLVNFQDFHVGDLFECYKVVEVARTE